MSLGRQALDSKIHIRSLYSSDWSHQVVDSGRISFLQINSVRFRKAKLLRSLRLWLRKDSIWGSNWISWSSEIFQNSVSRLSPGLHINMWIFSPCFGVQRVASSFSCLTDHIQLSVRRCSPFNAMIRDITLCKIKDTICKVDVVLEVRTILSYAICDIVEKV